MSQAFHNRLSQTEAEISEEADRLRFDAARLDQARQYLDAALQVLGGGRASTGKSRKKNGLTQLVLRFLRVAEKPLTQDDLIAALQADPAFSGHGATDLTGPLTAVLYRLRRTGIVKHDDGTQGKKAWSLV
jgi:hypothetical protein